MLLMVFTTTISATNVNGRFVVMGTDNGKLEVLLQINTNTGSDDMGGATIVIEFNNYTLNFNSNPQVNAHYVFHNFNEDNYSPATVTKPVSNKLWLNIDLPFNNSNNGFIVSGSNGWTDVVTLFFDIISTNDTLKLDWQITNPYWGIYDSDNTNLWSVGSFQNLTYAVNDVTSPEIISASLLDSVKLEILFSEPVESTSALNISNYSITKGISVLSGLLSTDQNKLILNTTSHTVGQQYTITLNNVRDLAGNLISAQNNFISYADSNNKTEDEKFIPIEFSLQQNYPNPFNPSTKISWQSPVGSHQTIKVYDILGNEVVTLVDEFKTAGSYEVEFNSENLASGVYIYRLQTAEFTKTKKMMLLR